MDPTIGASLISGGLGMMGGFIQNAGAASSAEQAAGASEQFAREQMAFQKDMFEHRYQMQTQDMIKAGLNPMLSAGASPPGAPGGASGSAPQAPVQNVVAAGLNSASDALNMSQALRRTQADIELNHETQDKIHAQATAIKNDTPGMDQGVKAANARAAANYASSVAERHAAENDNFYQDYDALMKRASTAIGVGSSAIDSASRFSVGRGLP